VKAIMVCVLLVVWVVNNMNIRYMDEKTIDELKKLREIKFIANIISIIMGAIYLVSAYYLYFVTFLIVLPIMLFLTGISLLLLSAMPDNLSLMIYLKEYIPLIIYLNEKEKK
jgi:uncharacterized membrane protein